MSMVLATIRVPSGMALLCIISGPLLTSTYLQSAPVEDSALLNVHYISSNRGGFPLLELRDKTVSLLTEVCSGVAIGPPLQQLSGEDMLEASTNRDDGNRIDFVADGFWWMRRERGYFDICVFNPYTPSNWQSFLPSTYRIQEREETKIPTAYPWRWTWKFLSHCFFFIWWNGKSDYSHKCLASLVAEKWKHRIAPPWTGFAVVCHFLH